MTDNGEPLTLESVRSAGDGNWGWPSCLVFSLRNADGELVEAVIRVDEWRKPERGIAHALG